MKRGLPPTMAAVLCLVNHPALAVPAFRSIIEIGEYPLLLFCLFVLLLCALHEWIAPAFQLRVPCKSNRAIHVVSAAPAHQVPTTASELPRKLVFTSGP